MKSSIPVSCPWGSTRSRCMAPIRFRLPIGSLVLSLHICDPLPVPRWSLAKGPACSGIDLPSQWTALGLSMLQPWGPHSLSAAIYGPCTCWAQGCCFRRCRGQSFWWASQCSAHCRPPPRSSARSLWPLSPCPCPDCNVPGPPPTSCCTCRKLEWSQCRPADLAPVHVNCWQSTVHLAVIVSKNYCSDAKMLLHFEVMLPTSAYKTTH